MVTTVDVIVLGTGSAAQSVAYPCREAGWSVAVVDENPFGGTCLLRGCDPKKVLVGVAELVDWSRRMQGKGVAATSPSSSPISRRAQAPRSTSSIAGGGHSSSLILTFEGNRYTPNYRGIPSVVFTTPPLARVGLLEEAAPGWTPHWRPIEAKARRERAEEIVYLIKQALKDGKQSPTSAR
jgi:pyruvate/2-oxoglutarate dehydrogenase complex dihydrolipoamide dehydrogenase (E3) component